MWEMINYKVYATRRSGEHMPEMVFNCISDCLSVLNHWEFQEGKQIVTAAIYSSDKRCLTCSKESGIWEIEPSSREYFTEKEKLFSYYCK